jgi:hypothetical protein
MRASWLLLLLLAFAAPVRAQDRDAIDGGNFLVYVRDQAIGAEEFHIEGRADSINSGARSYRKARTESGETMAEKQMVLTASRDDFALHF